MKNSSSIGKKEVCIFLFALIVIFWNLTYWIYMNTNTAWITFDSDIKNFKIEDAQIEGAFNFYDGEYLINKGELRNETPLFVSMGDTRIRIDEENFKLQFSNDSFISFENIIMTTGVIKTNELYLVEHGFRNELVFITGPLDDTNIRLGNYNMYKPIIIRCENLDVLLNEKLISNYSGEILLELCEEHPDDALDLRREDNNKSSVISTLSRRLNDLFLVGNFDKSVIQYCALQWLDPVGGDFLFEGTVAGENSFFTDRSADMQITMPNTINTYHPIESSIQMCTSKDFKIKINHQNILPPETESTNEDDCVYTSIETSGRVSSIYISDQPFLKNFKDYILYGIQNIIYFLFTLIIIPVFIKFFSLKNDDEKKNNIIIQCIEIYGKKKRSKSLSMLRKRKKKYF